MKKNEPISISDIDVKPISDEELLAILGQQQIEAYWTFPGECCDDYSFFYC